MRAVGQGEPVLQPALENVPAERRRRGRQSSAASRLTSECWEGKPRRKGIEDVQAVPPSNAPPRRVRKHEPPRNRVGHVRLSKRARVDSPSLASSPSPACAGGGLRLWRRERERRSARRPEDREHRLPLQRPHLRAPGKTPGRVPAAATAAGATADESVWARGRLSPRGEARSPVCGTAAGTGPARARRWIARCEERGSIGDAGAFLPRRPHQDFAGAAGREEAAARYSEKVRAPEVGCAGLRGCLSDR